MTRMVLVHGAWHGGWAWERLRPRLEALGHTVETVELPSSGSGGDLAADAAAVHRCLGSTSEPAVLVAHSYGGQPVTEAAGSATVAHLVYVAAFQLDAGQSLLDAIGGAPPPWTEVDDTTGMMTVPDPAAVFYQDLDHSLAADLAGRLGVHSLSSFANPLTRAGWREVPSTYVVCDRDVAMPRSVQEAMAERADRVVHLDCGHSPFVAEVDELAAALDAVTAGRA